MLHNAAAGGGVARVELLRPLISCRYHIRPQIERVTHVEKRIKKDKKSGKLKRSWLQPVRR